MNRTQRLWLLLAATRPELEPTVDRLGLVWRDVTRADGGNTFAAVTGVGHDRALACLEAVAAEHTLAGVVSIGFAGGLSPQRAAGELLDIGTVINEAGERQPLGDAAGATLLTLDRMVCTVDEKRELHRRLAADAVDMETFHVARWVARHGERIGRPISFRALRAISDPADAALPAEAVDWVDGRGRPRPTAAMRWLARHPRGLPTLIRLQRASRVAGHNLAAAAETLLESIDGA